MRDDIVDEINDGTLSYPTESEDMDFTPATPGLAALFDEVVIDEPQLSHEQFETNAPINNIVTEDVDDSIQTHIGTSEDQNTDVGEEYTKTQETDSVINSEATAVEENSMLESDIADMEEEEIIQGVLDMMSKDPKIMQDFIQYISKKDLSPSASVPAVTANQMEDFQKLAASVVKEALDAQTANMPLASQVQQATNSTMQRPMVGDGADRAVQSINSAINGLVGAGATALNTTSKVATAAVEAGQNLIQKYLDSRTQNQSSVVEMPTNQTVQISSDPAIATVDMRSDLLKAHQDLYIQAIDEFWQTPEMKPVQTKIAEMAQERGLSVQDVIAKINTGDPEFTEINREFNEAMGNSTKAQKAKEKGDAALDNWSHAHERLNHTAARMSPNFQQKQDDTFDLLSESEKEMLKNSSLMPKTENEPQSNMEKLAEQIERIKEAIRAVIEAIKNMFGKGNNNESSNTPSPS